MTREEKSYYSYLRQHMEWENKGYAMDAPLTQEQYYHNYELAVSLGEKNIARSFASEDRLATYREAQRLTQTLKELQAGREISVKELIHEGEAGYREGRKTYRTTTIDASALEDLGFDISVKAIKAQGLGETYRALTDAGLSPREAGAIIDEVYRS